MMPSTARGARALVGAALSLVACALTPPLASAGEGAADLSPWGLPAPQGRGYVLLFGGPDHHTSVDIVQGDVPWPEARALTQAPLLSADPDAFGHALASALVGAGGAAFVAADPRCSPDPGGFLARLDEAREDVRFQLLEDARAALDLSYTAYFCGDEVPDRDALWELLFLRGVAAVYGGSGNPRELFQQALAVDPQRRAPEEYDKAVKDAFTRAVKYMESFPPVPVALPGDALSPLSLMLDGAPVGEGYALLSQGTHHLQVVDPRGRSLRGMQVYVAAQAGGVPPVLLPRELALEGGGDALDALMASVSDGALTPLQGDALQRLLDWTGAPWILLAAPLDHGGGAKVIGVFAGEDDRSHYIRVATPQVAAAPPEARRRLAPVFTLVGGGLAVLTGAGAGALYYADATGAFDVGFIEDEGRAAVGLAAGAGGLAVFSALSGVCWGVQDHRAKAVEVGLAPGGLPGASITLRF